MKTEADVRRFLESNPDATREDVVAFVKGERIAPAAPMQKAGVLGTGANLLRTAAQGATFGLADEGEGLVRGLAALVPGGKSPAEAYREGTDTAREGVEEFRDEHPVLSFGTELAGGIASGFGAGRTLAKTGIGQAAKALPKATRLLGGSTLAGAAAGAGATEGGLRERLGGALVGGGAGFALAGGLGLAGGLAGGVRNAGRTVLDLAGLSPEKTPASALARAVLPTSAEDRMLTATAKALGRSGKTADEIAAEVAENPQLMGADITPRLARAVGTVPSDGAREVGEALTRRQEGQAGRLAGRVQERTGLTRGNAPALIDDISREQQEAARPLYDAAYAVDIKDRRVLSALENPAFAAAYQRGRRIAALEGVDLPDPYKKVKRGGKTVRVLNKDAVVPVQAIDYMKRGMDDLISGRMSGGKMAQQEARALRAKLNTTLEAVDELVPEYGLARGTWGGAEAEKKAAELGSRFFNMTPAEVTREFANLSDAEKALARRSAVDQVILKLEGTGDTHDATKKLAGNDLLRQRLRLLFDSDSDMDALIGDVKREAEMGRTFNTFRGGSNTVDKAQDVADMMGVDLGEMAAAAANPVAALNPAALIARRGALETVRNAMQNVTERTANAASPFLMAQGDDLLTRLKAIEQRRRDLEAAAARRAGGARGLSTVAGLRAGSGN